MKYFKLLFLFLVLFIGLLKGFAYNSTYRVKVGETFTVHTTYKSNTISITWTYDHKSVVPSGYVGAASTSVTFEAIAPTLSSGSVIQSITYYRQDGYTKKQVDDWLVIVSPIQVSSISVSPSSKSLYEGQHVDLTATISPSNATNKEVKWTSEDSRVATVNSNGRVTAVKAGTTIIKCTAEDGSKKSGECRITVEEPIPVTNIDLYPTNITLNGCEYYSLACTVSPSNATNKSLTWISNRADVATVNSYGIVQGVGAGNAIITCAANDGSGVSATCNVTVNLIDPTSISLPSEMTINIGETVEIPFTFEPNNAISSISWTSDNQSIVTVSSTGEVKGVGAGTTYIRATTANEKTDFCKLTVEAPLFIGVKYAIAGSDHSLVIKEDGSLWACGNNQNGQLCNKGTIELHSFKKIMDDVFYAAAGGGNSRIIKDDGSLWACGSNSWGQLCDGTTTTRRSLKKVMDNVAYVTGGLQTFIIKEDASLWVCGYDDKGSLGNGTKKIITSPVKIMDDVASVSAGGNHTLIVKKDGTLWACGWNYYGQLGDGTTTDRTTPVKIMENVATVAAGGGHSLIVKKDATLWACGSNSYGELGDGTTTNKSSLIKIMDDVNSVEATSTYSFIIKTDGSLWACGYNEYGQLGNGTTSTCLTPVKIMEDVRYVSTMGFYTLFVKKDGSLWACGRNNYGQLGDGTTTRRLIPVEIMEGNSASGINGIQYEKDIFYNSSDTKIYSITGQRISYPKKGINIINGKKVVVR